MLATKNYFCSAVAVNFTTHHLLLVFAGLLGFSMLYVAAFANSDILHNAAHDTRHCHCSSLPLSI